MKRFTAVLVICVMLVSQTYGLALAQSGNSFNTETSILTLNATVEQLAWMAYGAPVKTYMALGCTQEAEGYAGSLATARTIRTISNITLLAGFVLTYLDLSDEAVPIGVILLVAALVGDSVSSVIDLMTRNNAKSNLQELAEKHLNGEETCIVR